MSDIEMVPLGVPLTRHARQRMAQRSIDVDAVDSALNFGREVHARGGRRIYALGRKEVRRLAAEGVNLADHQGVQVVCAGTGHVLTVFRDSDFRRLRAQGSKRRRGCGKRRC